MTRRVRWNDWLAILVAVALIFGLVAVLAPPAQAGHSFPTSVGVYRIPYADGVNVTVSNDHHDHSPAQDRIDMFAGAGSQLVAAASGWIRGVRDVNGDYLGRGDGLDINGGAQDDSLEHSCTDSSTVVGNCSDYNNYVWIEHPNGEWTKYSHVATGTASANWAVGDWINAGEAVGLENDIGAATGPHLHWEAGLPSDPNDSTPFSTLGGFLQGTNVVALICDISDNLFESGESYLALPCVHIPPTADAGGPYQVDEGSAVLLDGTGSSDPDGNPLTYAWEPDTNLDNPALAQPMYTGVDDVIADPVALTVYDQIEALRDNDGTSVTVLNVPPSVDAAGDAIDEGGTATVATTFSDPGLLDTHTAWIDWGDGNAGPSVLSQASGGGNLNPSHVYVEDGVYSVTVVITDDDGGIGFDKVDVTVLNVPPTVSAAGDTINEGASAAVTATFTDPGILDTHTATIDWGDGTPPEPVVVDQGAGSGSLEGSHGYGDNGVYNVTVAVTDDDGGVGSDTVAVIVNNIDPELALDVGDAVSFPGGDYFVGRIGVPQNHAASASDPGSDDLTFTWGFGAETTYFNDGVAPDPPKSPQGTFPFFAADDADVDFALPGAYEIDLTVTDDDGGSDAAGLAKVVTGDATSTEGVGWWKHQYGGLGRPQVDEAFLEGYLDVINAVSSVFSESVAATTLDEAEAVLSATGSDRRVHATTDLLAAWLHFASGGVAWDAAVPLEGGATVPFLDAMHQIELTILDGDATDAELLDAELLAQRVRHAG